MVEDFLRKAKDAIVGPSDDEKQMSDNAQGQFGNVRPASEDPYGDPADQEQGQGQFGNVRPASEDPYGDPADQ